MKVKPAVPTRHECQDATPDRPRAPQDYVTRNALAAIRPSTGALTQVARMACHVLVRMQAPTRAEGARGEAAKDAV